MATYSAVLQSKQDHWLAGQIAGRALFVRESLLPQNPDVLIPSNSYNNQLMLHRPLQDVRGLGPAVYAGVAMDYISSVYPPNSFPQGEARVGIYDYSVI